MAEQGLKEMDINNDGKVSQEEFLKYALEQNGLSQWIRLKKWTR